MFQMCKFIFKCVYLKYVYLKYVYLKYEYICHDCKYNHVETKIVVQDTHHPTFAIQRKYYCSECWLKNVQLNSHPFSR